MKIARARAMLMMAVAAVTLSSSAWADDGGWYAGFNAGQARAKIDDPRITDGLLNQGFTTTSISNGDSHFGFKGFGGYSFNRYFALETGYFNLGRFGYLADTAPAGSLRGESKIQGANVDAVVSVPIGDRFSLFARGGFIYAEAKDRFYGTGAVAVIDPAPRKWAPNYKYGAGAQYDFTPFIGLRIEAERYRINDAVGNRGDVDLYSAGLVFKFGRTRQTTPPSPPPAPPPPQAEATPVVQPPPPPPAPPLRKRVSFSADSLFEFGKDTVNPAGKGALDAFALELKGSRFEVVTVTGHTDRIGSHEYNMKLSTRRAEVVKSYLVETSGIPADKVTAQGADGSDPVTKPDECPGTKRTPKLIACLQPDRRVDVEVVGSRLEAAPNN